MAPNVSRFLSVFQTKANWRVRPINFRGDRAEQRGLGTGLGGGGRGASRRGGRCPREMPVSVRGARACSGWHLPRGLPAGVCALGASGLSQTGQAWGANARCRPGRQACRQAGEGRREEGFCRPARAGPGQRLEPKVKSQSASCWFMLGVTISQIKSPSL